jgi:hypothetical protein
MGAESAQDPKAEGSSIRDLLKKPKASNQKVIDHLKRTTTVSVETMRIINEMHAAER